MVKVKEKYFKANYWPAGILLDVKTTNFLKFKLGIKFTNNKNCCFIFVNFLQDLRYKFISLK